MQIETLVEFHKAVGDVTRIRILSLLARKPMSGSELAERLGLTPATITHHTQKLKKIGLVKEKRDKNTITFFLLPRELSRYAESLVTTILPSDLPIREEWDIWRGDAAVEEKRALGDGEKERMIAPFFQENGKLKQIPSQWKKRLYALEKLVSGLEYGRTYSEKEISEYLRQYHEDFATLRRELIMNHMMHRADGVYSLNPPELWKTVE